MNEYKKNLTAVGACALGRAFGYEPLVAHRLIDAAGSIEGLFSLPEREREELLGPYSRYRGRLSDALIDEAARDQGLSGLSTWALHSQRLPRYGHF